MTADRSGSMADRMPTQWLIAACVLLSSALVLANDAARLEFSSSEGEILSDDIYERAEGWREPMVSDEWRVSKPEPESRIRFGFDSTHEELRARNRGKFSSRRIDPFDRPPTDQFELRFK